MSSKILITGATGNVGGPALRSLLAEGHQVVAAVREPERARAALALPCDYVPFDFGRPETHRPALAGVDRLFLMRPPAISNLAALLSEFLQAARDAGVKHLVYLSVMGADRIPGNPHRAVEQQLRASTIPFTFLRPAFFMQNLGMHHAQLIRERGEICLPAGRGRTSFIDTRDIGEAAARVLTKPGHENRAYTLTGTEALTYEEVATLATALYGRPIRYSNPSPWRFRREMLAQGYPSDFINFMILLYTMTRVGLAAPITNELERLIGRPPRRMRDYLQDHAHLFTPG